MQPCLVVKNKKAQGTINYAFVCRLTIEVHCGGHVSLKALKSLNARKIQEGESFQRRGRRHGGWEGFNLYEGMIFAPLYSLILFLTITPPIVFT